MINLLHILTILGFIIICLQPDKYYKNLNNLKCCHYIHYHSFHENDSVNVLYHIILPFSILLPIVIHLANYNKPIIDLLSTLFITNIIVGLFKTFSNSPRPDIIGRINFYYNKLNLNNNVSIYDKINILKNSKYQSQLLDGYKSFISGHASLVFSMLSIIIYIIHPTKNNILLIIFIISLMYALYCCNSRLIDNKHHHYDVIAGILNGIIIPYILLN
jgi:membrane-associated phospholipid phosphatase